MYIYTVIMNWNIIYIILLIVIGIYLMSGTEHFRPGGRSGSGSSNTYPYQSAHKQNHNPIISHGNVHNHNNINYSTPGKYNKYDKYSVNKSGYPYRSNNTSRIYKTLLDNSWWNSWYNYPWDWWTNLWWVPETSVFGSDGDIESVPSTEQMCLTAKNLAYDLVSNTKITMSEMKKHWVAQGYESKCGEL